MTGQLIHRRNRSIWAWALSSCSVRHPLRQRSWSTTVRRRRIPRMWSIPCCPTMFTWRTSDAPSSTSRWPVRSLGHRQASW